MTAFPNGVETRGDAVRFLRAIDSRDRIKLGKWDIDDFSSCSHPDPAIDRCRRRVRDELIDLPASKKVSDRERVTPLVTELIAELENNASNN